MVGDSKTFFKFKYAIKKIGIRSYSSQPNSGYQAGFATDFTSKEVNPGQIKEINTLANAG